MRWLLLLPLAACSPHVERCLTLPLPPECAQGGGGGLSLLARDDVPARPGPAPAPRPEPPEPEPEPDHDDHYSGPDLDDHGDDDADREYDRSGGKHGDDRERDDDRDREHDDE